MRLSQAIKYHADITLDGIGPDGRWHQGVASGKLEPFSRFISARDFGVVKRQFQSAHETLLSGKFYTVRSPTGSIYILQALNQDLNPEVYNNVYLLQQTDSVVEILINSTESAASGLPTANVEKVESEVHGYLSRLSSQSSDEFEQVKYTGSVLTLPGDCKISTDNLVRIDGNYYDVLEVWVSVLNLMAKVSRRSSSVR